MYFFTHLQNSHIADLGLQALLYLWLRQKKRLKKCLQGWILQHTRSDGRMRSALLCICFTPVCPPVVNDRVREERRSKVTSLWSRTIRGGGHVAYYIDTYPTEACNYLPAVTLLSAATSERSRRIRPEGAALPPSAETCYFTATALALTKTSTWRKGGPTSCERKAVLCKVACSLSSVMVGSVSGAAVTTAEHQTLNHLVSELDKSRTSLRTCSSLSEWS